MRVGYQLSKNYELLQHQWVKRQSALPIAWEEARVIATLILAQNLMSYISELLLSFCDFAALWATAWQLLASDLETFLSLTIRSSDLCHEHAKRLKWIKIADIYKAF
jgi:hypothetical protein